MPTILLGLATPSLFDTKLSRACSGRAPGLRRQQLTARDCLFAMVMGLTWTPGTFGVLSSSTGFLDTVWRNSGVGSPNPGFPSIMTEIPGKKKSKVKGGLMKRIKDIFRKGSGSTTSRSEIPSLTTNDEGFKLGGPSIQSHHEPGSGPAFLDGRSNQESLEVPLNSVTAPQLACDEPRGEAERPLIKDSRDDTEPEGVSSALSPEADISVPSEGIGSKIYGSVKTTLRLVVEMGDVFPPVKSTAAGLLFIFDVIDAYGENHEEFRKLLQRVNMLSAIMEYCPKDVPQEVLDRFSGLSLTLLDKTELLQRKLDPTRSKVERVILSTEDKDEIIKITQEVTMVIEIAMFKSVTQNEFRTIQAVNEIKWLKEHIT
ncbi:hypothetical protein DFP72DRAFT_1044954, partial [Ephemerocybe angulata]